MAMPGVPLSDTPQTESFSRPARPLPVVWLIAIAMFVAFWL